MSTRAELMCEIGGFAQAASALVCESRICVSCWRLRSKALSTDRCWVEKNDYVDTKVRWPSSFRYHPTCGDFLLLVSEDARQGWTT